MLFNSFEFILFFPIVTILYFLVPYRFRTILLLAASCFFYAFFKWEYIFILVFTIIIDYYAAIWIEASSGKKRKWALAISIIANLGVLGLFKYYYFIIDSANIFFWHALNHKVTYNPIWDFVLPIGLSFHTFQAMSYTIEVYKGNQKVERNFLTYALYVMFYPQLVAGPIERPQNVLWQFYEKFNFDFAMAKSGLRLMLWGVFKKVLIGDNLGVFVDKIFHHPQDYTGLPLIIAALFYTIQIYCDFSGYSDIAIGSARVMGFKLMKNFDRPYMSTTIAEFWRRWHISLSTWFRDYLYIPLGGNRVSPIRKHLNLFIVFLASGVWHGAAWHFIFWGVLHGVYLIFGQITEGIQAKLWGKSRVGNFINWLITFSLVVFAWVFFRAKDFGDAFYVIENFFKRSSHTFSELLALIGERELVVLLSSIFVLEFVQFLQSKFDVSTWLESKPKWIEWSAYYMILFGIICFGYFGDVQFIYFQF